jgi:DNA polymerase III subunit beta
VKFRSERDALVDVLSTVGRAVGGRGVSSVVLSGVLLVCEGNRLTGTGTDLDLTIRMEQEVIGLEDGACVVPARLATEIVRSLEAGAVTLEAGEERIEISAARSHFELRTFPVVEFPTVSQSSAPGHVLGPALVEGLRQVVRAASTDDARPLLTGVLITTEADVVRLVATDSYRLALRDLRDTKAITDAQEILVPARALVELQRLPGLSGTADSEEAGVEVTSGTHEITFRLGSVETGPGSSTARTPITAS